jgi:6-phosphogluconolactonase
MSGAVNMHDAGDAGAEAATAIAASLQQAIAVRGRASLMVSGGSSPKPVYAKLCNANLDWSKVTIGLVDERWVDPGQAGSNEDFIRDNLLQNKAAKATFFGLKTNHATVAAGLTEAEARFADVAQPFDVCVMGMGGDAHTASWFPNSGGLGEAFSLENNKILCAVDATGCEVAGDHPARISLTLRAVLDAHVVVLFIPGEAKRRVFDAAPTRALFDAPVQALLRAGSKLHIFASAL